MSLPIEERKSFIYNISMENILNHFKYVLGTTIDTYLKNYKDTKDKKYLKLFKQYDFVDNISKQVKAILISEHDALQELWTKHVCSPEKTLTIDHVESLVTERIQNNHSNSIDSQLEAEHRTDYLKFFSSYFYLGMSSLAPLTVYYDFIVDRVSPQSGYFIMKQFDFEKQELLFVSYRDIRAKEELKTEVQILQRSLATEEITPENYEAEMKVLENRYEQSISVPDNSTLINRESIFNPLKVAIGKEFPIINYIPKK